MNKQFLYFITSRGIFTLAGELVNIFGVLYVYKVTGGNAVISLGAYALVYYVYGLLFYPSMFFIERIGTKTSIIIGSILIILGNISLQFISENLLFLLGWVLLVGIGKIFYYMSYTYYVQILMAEKHVGQNTSFLTIGMSFAMLLVPLVGGFITQNFGISGLTVLSIFFVSASIIPLLKLENYHFKISRRLFDLLSVPHIRKAMKLNFVNELQSREKFWELYVFIFFAGNYANMGVFMTLIAILVVPLNFLLGQYLDHHNRKYILKVSSLVASLVWLGKMISTTIAQFTAVDIVHKLNSSIKNQIVDTLNANYLMEEGQIMLLDERIAVKEVVQNFFIGSNLLLGIFILTVFGFPAVFLQASLAALLFYLL